MTLHRLTCAALAAVLSTATAMPALAQSSADVARFRTAQDRFDREYRIYRQEADRFAAARGGYRDAPPPNGGYRNAPPPPGGDYRDDGYDDDDDRYENGYDPARYYRQGSGPVRTLTPDDRVYAGNDGRYYCRRSDGTTGLILGAVAGGLLGNVIDGGHSRAVGTIIGGGGGALAGRAIEQNGSVQCR